MVKNSILFFFLLIVLVACIGNSKEGRNENGSAENAISASNDPIYQKGLELVARNNCLNCHKVDDVFTGPSYRQIATRYKGASAAEVAELAQRIIKGGNGMWGSALMTPHPGISRQDAEAMVQYSLLLKK